MESDLDPAARRLMETFSDALRALRAFHEREVQGAAELFARNPGASFEEEYPQPISAVVWVFSDGLVLTRYWDWRGGSRFEAIAQPGHTTEGWLMRQNLIPTEQGLLRLASFMPGSTGVFRSGFFGRCMVRYASVDVIRRGDPRLSDHENWALIDFQATLLTIALARPHPPQRKQLLDELREVAAHFRGRLDTAEREEDLQAFLRDNPICFAPYYRVHPKFDLGAEYEVDFVIESQASGDAVTRFVEIEPASHRLFTRSGDPTAKLRHAQRQIDDWKTWARRNHAYLRERLHGLDTIDYEIIIGRSGELSADSRRRLNTISQEVADLTIMTYDELLSRLETFISNLAVLVV